jgi:hypothetical protein
MRELSKEVSQVLDDLEMECLEFAAYEGDHFYWMRRARAIKSARRGVWTPGILETIREFKKEQERLARAMKNATAFDRPILEANRIAAKALGFLLEPDEVKK